MVNFGLNSGVILSFLTLFRLVFGRNVGVELQWDPKGYILYCPCSGRFSNQVDQLLGSLFFAERVNRVLVLPPFIDYQHVIGQTKDNLYIPVTEYFDLNTIREYYPDVVTFEDFMYQLAPTHWPITERVAYCSSKAADGNEGICPRKGNPFETFWKAQNIEFVRSEVWSGDLHFNVDYDPWRLMWEETYPASEHPILAFMGAPTSSPLPPERDFLHRYLKWSADIAEEGDHLIEQYIDRPYIGIHLRNGADWARTCDHADGTFSRLLSSHQCLGLHGVDKIHRQLCMQSEEHVIEELQDLLQEVEAKTIFVATDHVSMQDDLQQTFPNMKIVTLDPEKPQLDMYILSESDHFVGNCISAFSAFVRRHRDVTGRKTTYFGQRHQAVIHDEF